MVGARAPCARGAEVHHKDMMPTFDEILANFEFIDDWEERYRYIIELESSSGVSRGGHSDANKVQGCASQVWLETHVVRAEGAPVLNLPPPRGRQLTRISCAASWRSLDRISIPGARQARSLETDEAEIFDTLGLSEHLTPQRSNGVARNGSAHPA